MEPIAEVEATDKLENLFRHLGLFDTCERLDPTHLKIHVWNHTPDLGSYVIDCVLEIKPTG